MSLCFHAPLPFLSAFSSSPFCVSPRSAPYHSRCIPRCPRLCAEHPSTEDLSSQLLSGDKPTQLVALVSLPSLPSSTALSLLLSSNLLSSSVLQLRLVATATLGKLRDPSQAPLLTSILKNRTEDYAVRAAAAGALGELLLRGTSREGLIDDVVNDLVTVINAEETEFTVRYSAVVALGNIGGDGVWETLGKLLKTSRGMELAAAVEAVGEMTEETEVSEGMMALIINVKGNEEAFVRMAVARTLGKCIERPGVRDILIGMQQVEDSVIVRITLDDVLNGTKS